MNSERREPPHCFDLRKKQSSLTLLSKNFQSSKDLRELRTTILDGLPSGPVNNSRFSLGLAGTVALGQKTATQSGELRPAIAGEDSEKWNHQSKSQFRPRGVRLNYQILSARPPILENRF
jgi:hypothetical protein